jgi:hypothetical protein
MLTGKSGTYATIGPVRFDMLDDDGPEKTIFDILLLNGFTAKVFFTVAQ